MAGALACGQRACAGRQRRRSTEGRRYAAGWCEAPIDRHRSRRLPAVVGFPALDLLPACLDGHLCGRLLELPLELRELLLDGLRLAGRLQLSNRLQHLTESQNVVCAHLALRSFGLPRRWPASGGHRAFLTSTAGLESGVYLTQTRGSNRHGHRPTARAPLTTSGDRCGTGLCGVRRSATDACRRRSEGRRTRLRVLPSAPRLPRSGGRAFSAAHRRPAAQGHLP